MTPQERAAQIPMPWRLEAHGDEFRLSGVDVPELQRRIAGAIGDAVLAEREACAAKLEEIATNWESGPFTANAKADRRRRWEYACILRQAAEAVRTREAPC
jgi:hypothetical protein